MSKIKHLDEEPTPLDMLIQYTIKRTSDSIDLFSEISDRPSQASSNVHERLYNASKLNKRPNQPSNALLSKPRHSFVNMNVEDRLLYNTKKDGKNLKARQSINEQLKECSFCPRINTKERMRKSATHLELYREHKERQAKRNDSQKEVPLQKVTNLNTEAFYQRMKIAQAKREIEVTRKRQEVHRNVDKETGRPFFSPAVNKLVGGNTQGTVWERLHQRAVVKQTKSNSNAKF